jgi:hypothetical protein
MRSTRWSDARIALEFHRHDGSSPLDLADQWHDLKAGDHPLPKELQLNKKEKSEKGLKRTDFFVAHFFLWAYLKMHLCSPHNSKESATSISLEMDKQDCSFKVKEDCLVTM